MRRRLEQKSSGFTLIEIMMVLAISTLLSLILLGLYRNTQDRTQFRDAIERVVTQLEKSKAEANNTVNSNPTNPGANSGRVAFGKAVNFTAANGTSFMRIYNLSAANQESLPSSVLLNENQPLQQIEIPWGVTYLAPGTNGSSDNYVIFARALTDGKINTFVYQLTDPSQLTDPTFVSFDTGAANPNDTKMGTLNFTSNDGKLSATVYVDANSGEITRKYNN